MRQITFLLVALCGLVTVSAFFTRPNLNFKIEDEYNYIPDEKLVLHYKHYTEIDDPEPFRFRPERDIVYILFTRSNPTNGQILDISNPSSITNSHFNPRHPTRFLIHGWNNDRNSAFNIMIRDAYLAEGNFNVIVVDWGAGANTVNYVSARNRVHPVGVVTANFIDTLVVIVRLDTGDTAVIGYSLGAHAAGITGKHVRNRINTIHGLDPAGPMFYNRWPDDRLDKDDAYYVEVMHTNGGTLGFMDPIGYSDFYPNGGQSQPGCGIDLVGMCAHSRCYEFFAESISTPLGFYSIPCNFSELRRSRCSRVGIHGFMSGDPSNYRRYIGGVYYLNTNNRSPFALGRQ